MGEIDTRLPPRRMKVFAIIGLTTLAAVCLALPAEEHIREEVSPLWEQETSLYERMVTPSLYSQQSDLFASMVEVEACKGRKVSRCQDTQKGGARRLHSPWQGDRCLSKKHNQAVLGPFQRHKTVTA